MARPWKPARRCSACLYPNDSDVNYCQACGTLTRPQCTAAPVPPVDETAIQERFDEFQSVFRSKPYERQKSALEQQLFKFLGALSPPRTVTSCTARLLGCSSEDVAHYLGWKSGEVAKRYMQGSDATVSLTLLEKIFPRAASGTVTPVSNADNLQAAV